MIHFHSLLQPILHNMPPFRRVSVFSFTAMALVFLLDISKNQVPGFLPLHRLHQKHGPPVPWRQHVETLGVCDDNQSLFSRQSLLLWARV